MIRTYFGLTQNPFTIDEHPTLLAHQQRHFDILKVHSQQGGLCLILGEPGTGKSVLKNHNLILIGQPQLNTTLQLRHHFDFKNRITYSAKIDTLAPTALTDYIHTQLDRVQLPHRTFTEDAIALILRASEGTLRAVKNLCTSALIEAVRDQTKTVDLKQVNTVLMQPHWRHNAQSTHGEPEQPLIYNNQKSTKPHR
jgi:type II secretory pathway predicted ATPase ExeA